MRLNTGPDTIIWYEIRQAVLGAANQVELDRGLASHLHQTLPADRARNLEQLERLARQIRSELVEIAGLCELYATSEGSDPPAHFFVRRKEVARLLAPLLRRAAGVYQQLGQCAASVPPEAFVSRAPLDVLERQVPESVFEAVRDYVRRSAELFRGALRIVEEPDVFVRDHCCLAINLAHRSQAFVAPKWVRRPALAPVAGHDLHLAISLPFSALRVFRIGALAAHEVAHAFANGLIDRDPQAFQREVSDLVERGRSHGLALQPNEIEYLMVESFCDRVALHTAGPGYFAAFWVMWVGVFGVATVDNFRPALFMAVRLRAMVTALSDDPSALPMFAEAVRALNDRYRRAVAPPVQRTEDAALEAVEACLARVVAEFGITMGSPMARPEQPAAGSGMAESILRLACDGQADWYDKLHASQVVCPADAIDRLWRLANLAISEPGTLKETLSRLPEGALMTAVMRSRSLSGRLVYTLGRANEIRIVEQARDASPVGGPQWSDDTIHLARWPGGHRDLYIGSRYLHRDDPVMVGHRDHVERRLGLPIRSIYDLDSSSGGGLAAPSDDPGWLFPTPTNGFHHLPGLALTEFLLERPEDLDSLLRAVLRSAPVRDGHVRPALVLLATGWADVQVLWQVATPGALRHLHRDLLTATDARMLRRSVTHCFESATVPDSNGRSATWPDGTWDGELILQASLRAPRPADIHSLAASLETALGGAGVRRKIGKVVGYYDLIVTAEIGSAEMFSAVCRALESAVREGLAIRVDTHLGFAFP